MVLVFHVKGQLGQVWKLKYKALIWLIVITTSLAGCSAPDPDPVVPEEDKTLDDDGDDRQPGSETSDENIDSHDPLPGVTVVAVIDSGINPYHWDFLAEHVPNNDSLPLDRDPANWLPGHPGEEAFDSYTKLNLTLTPDDPEANSMELYEKDKKEWNKINTSSEETTHMYWIPNTKIVGYVNFDDEEDGFETKSHGVGVSSAVVGNLFGTCPECLFVFINKWGGQSTEWALQQDWIDVQVNSWETTKYLYRFDRCVPEGDLDGEQCLAFRDTLYTDSDVDLQKTGSERGQAVFFAAGNGLFNGYKIPNPTLFSSQKGPDWLYVVGAIDKQGGRSYSGHNKPTDVSGVGYGYPVGWGDTVISKTTFWGTSIANPVVAGVYARALWLLRDNLDYNRSQQDGYIGINGSLEENACGAENPECALLDGRVHVNELREAFFRSARYGEEGWVVGKPERIVYPGGDVVIGSTPIPAETEEMRLAAEGHGSFWGRLSEDWKNESERVFGFLRGDWHEEQNPDQRAWMTALSWCRQQLWGEWEYGYWNDGVDLPEPDPEWPVRTWLVEECPRSGKTLLNVLKTLPQIPGSQADVSSF